MQSPLFACIKHKFILRLIIVVLLVSSLWLIGNQHSNNKSSATESISVSISNQLQADVVVHNNNPAHLLKSDVDVRKLLYRKRQPVLIKPDCNSVARSDRVFLDNRFWYVPKQICGPDTTFVANPHLHGLVPSCQKGIPFTDFAGVCESDVGILDACIAISEYACSTLCNYTINVDLPELMPTEIVWDEYAPDPYTSIPIEPITLGLNSTVNISLTFMVQNILTQIPSLRIVSLSEQAVLVSPKNITRPEIFNTQYLVFDVMVSIVSVNRPSFIIDSIDFQPTPSSDAWTITDVSKFTCTSGVDFIEYVTLHVKNA
jgi:hypothetical protein